MNFNITHSIMSYLCACLFLLVINNYGQHTFEILVDSSEYRTDILNETGRYLKFLETSDRFIVLDYENYRILFFQKGNTFSECQILKIVGEHSRVQEDQPFNPISYNRLSRDFTGIIFNENLWITNYTFGEIIKFNLDGDYQSSISGKYKILDSDDSTLYAFQNQGIYYFNTSENNFTYLKNIPDLISIKSDKNGTNVKIGSNRMCIKISDSLHVYNFNDYLQNDSVQRMFSKISEVIPDFEIMNNEIIWATDYNGNYRCCDLEGNNTHSGSFDDYTYSYNFTNNLLYYLSTHRIKIFDINFNELVSEQRYSFYVNLNFLGADSANIYFYDHRDGGFVISPFDNNENIFYYDPDFEINYSGWNREFRIVDNFAFLLSEWPPDSFYIYAFDSDQMSKNSFKVGHVQGFDVVGDTIFTISGKNLKNYSRDGSFLHSYVLNNLSNSNLQDIDSTSNILFAANRDKIFIGHDDKLNILDSKGQFLEMFDFTIYEPAQLFASKTEVICNSPLNLLDISTSEVSAFMPRSIPEGGFIFKDLYWYKAGENKYAYLNKDLVNIKDIKHETPKLHVLLQNYPNPFNPITIIEYSIPNQSNVTLKVFDILGREISTLLNEKQPKGYYQIKFDGSELTSGLYLYCLKTSPEIGGSSNPVSSSGQKFISVKKMILLK